MKAQPQRGLTLVELLVGLAIAMFVVAAGTLALARQLTEQRSLLVEARLMQDLRAAADLVARDLRRGGHWGDAAAGVWSAASAPIANPYAALAPGAAASDAASYAYSRDATENHALDSNEQFGLRLRNRAIELQLGAGNWQALTDATLIEVTEFTITPRHQTVELAELCARPCAEGDANCPLRLEVRGLEVQITARAAADPAVSRRLVSELRLRNDTISGACPA